MDANTTLRAGFSYTMVSGQSSNTDLESSSEFGVFVGIQNEFAKNVLVNLDVYPFNADTLKEKGKDSLTKTTIGTTTAISATYLF